MERYSYLAYMAFVPHENEKKGKIVFETEPNK